MEHHTETDSGASIRDGMKSINRNGLCTETKWKYDINNFSIKPPDNCYKEAKFHRSLKYKKIKNNLNDLKLTLSKGYPIIFGFDVFSNFETFNASKEEMPMPSGDIIGGHAVVAVGYSEERNCFLIRNSWGKDWGMDGYFMMPYSFITSKYCSDFWTLETIISKKMKTEMEYEKVEINLNEYMKTKPDKSDKQVHFVDKNKDEEDKEEIKVFIEKVKVDNNLGDKCLITDEE